MHHAILTWQPVQILQGVLEAMAETAQKQQRTRDEVQERFDQETSMSGCHKQRRKDLAERLRMEDTKLQRKQQNLKEAQGLRDRWQGEDSVMKAKHCLSCNVDLCRQQPPRAKLPWFLTPHRSMQGFFITSSANPFR